jgi:nucleoside-diphosphate-sugar epimerase
MLVAVTGASGFVGRHVCRQLSEAGHRTRALVRAPTDALAGMRNVEQRVVGDLERFDDWPGALQDVAAVVHLAGYAHGRGSESSVAAVNVEATRRAALARASHFIYVSTVKVFGEASGSRSFDERSALNPQDRYAISKARAEAVLRAIPGLPLTVLRPPLVYGPGVRANFLTLLRAIASGVPLPLGAVRNRRSLLYVGNLAHAIVSCLERGQAAVGRTYIVSDGQAVSTPALCAAIGKALGRQARLFPFPSALVPIRSLTLSLEVDDVAIRRELGWRPPFSFEEGLRATAAWYRNR